jgi:hypothetical protein
MNETVEPASTVADSNSEESRILLVLHGDDLGALLED